ncbi:MAG TPA: rRNA maturation RNase YbeY [Rhizomicrobium sp.]|jgi:probable rRNA maturation factor|nr:rRNA maturation RNase YbeY [Rhizomicrobium sp.]
MKRPKITLVVETPAWRSSKTLPAMLKRAALLVLGHVGARACEVTILLADDARLRDLNAQFRRLDKPTNVLSFPALENDENHLGDVAIAYGVTAREAKDAGKSLSHHATHLAVHGVLHLLGYDHETSRDARKMERLEIEILTALKIPDPYISRKAA